MLCLNIETYTDPIIQVFETLQTSLFFLMADSIWYRMKALREGDRFLLKTMVYEARMKAYSNFILFVIGYTAWTAIVIITGYME